MKQASAAFILEKSDKKKGKKRWQISITVDVCNVWWCMFFDPKKKKDSEKKIKVNLDSKKILLFLDLVDSEVFKKKKYLMKRENEIATKRYLALVRSVPFKADP